MQTDCVRFALVVLKIPVLALGVDEKLAVVGVHPGAGVDPATQDDQELGEKPEEEKRNQSSFDSFFFSTTDELYLVFMFLLIW